MRLSIPQMALMSRLLDEALPLDPEARRAWLERLSPEYQDLARHLHEALLPEERESAQSQFLASLPKFLREEDANAAPASNLQPGIRVGPYELIRVLGAGGMAVVWLARRADGAFKREMALKIPMLTHLRRDLEQRFARERDILASLEHPHIARLYDAGIEPAGFPYLSMEYVQGRPLTEWCDAHGLEISGRLQLFLQVLEAVQYAHEKQIIHRDIKPSNVLVTESGQVQLLDFGVAKLLETEEAEQAPLTGVYGRALTPDYASPELLRGDPLDARSDVYSLGVLLYELLTGVRPYRLRSAASLGLLEQAIATVEVSKPSAQIEPEAAAARATTDDGLARQLRGDLDAIALKALARKPAERYPSAAALADDVRCYLEGKPIRAQPARFPYRLRKLLRRNKTVVGVSVMAVAAILATAGYALYRDAVYRVKVTASALTLSSNAIPEKSIVVQSRAIAVLPFENLSSTPDNDYIALGMADSVLHELASLPELIVVARSSSFALGRPTPDAREAGRRLGVRYLVEGSVQRAGKALRVTAQLIDTTTDSQLWSLKVDRTVDDVFLVQDQIAQRVARELDVTVHGLSEKYARYGTDAYLAFLKGRALLESRKVKDVEESIRQFSHAIELAPAFAAAIAELAGAKLQLASLQSNPKTSAHKQWPEIETLVDRAIEIDPGAGEPYFLRAEYKLDEDLDGAEADFRKGLDLAPNFGPGLKLYASYLYDRNRYDEAVTVIDRARLVDPLSAENHYLKGEVMRLGLGRPQEAAELYLQALAVVPDFYPAYTRLAQVRFVQGRLAEAIKYGEKSIAIEPAVNWTRQRLVWFYVDIDDLSAARDVLRAHGSVDMTAEEALICYRAGNLERAESLLHENIGNPDFGTDSLAFDLATDAVVERAIAMHTATSARQFILSIPDLKKERGTLAAVADNFSAVAQLATLEHFAGNQAAGDDLARRILEFFDHGGHAGAPAHPDELEHAWALALLGQADAALSELEQLIRSGNHAGWWFRLERNAAFDTLRATPRFQAIKAETRIWLQNQTQQLEQMRLQGEVPRRQAATSTPNGC